MYLQRVAVAVIGGLFDLIADWLCDTDPGSAPDVDALLADLTDFLLVVSDGVSDRT